MKACPGVPSRDLAQRPRGSIGVGRPPENLMEHALARAQDQGLLANVFPVAAV